jgi:hypothetical protein
MADITTNIQDPEFVGAQMPDSFPDPLIPSIGPRPSTGTITNADWSQGQVSDDNALAAFYGTAGSVGTRKLDGPGTPTPVSPSSIDTSGRYPFQRIDFDNEELYAQGQGVLSKAGSAVIKGLGLAGTTFVNGTVGLVYGVGKWIDDGKFSSFYDNDLTRSLDGLNTDLENKFANYYTQEELSADWYSPKNLFSANFLFDKVIKNLGFAAGAALSGSLYTKALTSVRNIAGLGATGRLANALEATEVALQGTDKAARFAAMNKTLSDAARSYVGVYNNLNKAQRVIVAGLATAGEAGIEALHSTNEFRNKMISDFVDENQRMPFEEELAEIDKFAEGVGNTTFGLNVAVLTATNYLQFPKILGSSYKAERNILTKSADDIGLFDKVGKLEKTLARTSEEQLYRSTAGTSRLSRVSRFGKYFFSPIEAAEEGLQFVASTGSNNYFDKKYSDQESSILKDLFGHGLEQTLTTKEGIESLLIGGLSGAIMTARGTYREAQEEDRLRNSAVTAFNKSYLKSFLKDTIDAANRGVTLQSEREEAIRRGDVLQSKDLEHDFMFNYVLPRVKHGRLDLVKTDVDHYLQLASTEQGWIELQTDGIVGETDTREAFISRLNTLKQMAQDTSNLFQGLSLKYGSFVREDGTKIYSDTVLEKMVYAGMKVSDYDRRLTQMSNDLLLYGINPDQGTLSAMRFQEVDRGEEEDQPITEAIVSVLRSIDNLDVLDDTKDDLKQKYSDYFEVVLRRRAIMDEYTDIKRNPSKYDVQEAPITTAKTDLTPKEKIAVTTADGEEELEVGTEYYLGSAQYYNEKGQLIQRFPKLTILGKNEDGTIKIRDGRGQVRDIGVKELESYKLGKVSDTDANKKAKFVMDNINTPWFYNFGKDKGGKVEGFLRYSPKENKLEFVYKDAKGKVRVKEVTADQFSEQTAKKRGFKEPILTPGKPLSQLQLRSLAEFQEYNDTLRRQAKVDFKLRVLNELADQKRKESQRLAKRLESEQNRLSEAKVELEEVREQISNFSEETGLTKKNRAFKKQLKQLVDLVDDLSREISNIEKDLGTLSAAKQDLDIEIEDLNSIIADVDALEDGELMLEQLLALRYDMEAIADNAEDQMRYLGGVLKDVQKTLEDLIDFIFAGKNASEYGITEEDLRDLRNNPSTLEFVRNNPQLFDKLREALNRLDLVEDRFDVAQKTIQDIEGELDSLGKKYSEARRLADMYENLINVFDKKAKEWAEEQRQIKLLEQSEKYKKALFEQMKKSGDTSGDSSTGDPSEDRKKYADEQDRKKNITHFFISGTDPKYEIKGLPDDDFHRRHQRFLDRLLSGKIKNAEQIRVIPITINNQDDNGMPGFIKPDNKDAIRLVYIRLEDDGGVLVDENGEYIDPNEFNKVVYSNLPTTELVDTGNRLRYNNKSKLSDAQIKDMQSQWAGTRKKLLAITTAEATPSWRFAVSRGIEQTSNKENTVIETKAVTEDQLDQPVISVSTTGFIEIRPAGDIEGVEDAVAIPVGRPMLNINAGLSFLNNHNLTKQQQDDIFGLLQIFSKEVASRALKGQTDGLFGPVEVNGESYDIIRYLQNVLHWKIPGKDKAVGRNQIWIEDGRLFMGSNKVSVPFTPRGITNSEAVIKAFLAGTYHNVNNQPLNEIAEGKINQFIELGVNSEGNPFIRNAFKSYNHYLLSDKNPDGSSRQPVLTTRLIIPQPGEVQFIQRYPIVRMDDLAPKAREIKKEAAPKKEAAKDKSTEESAKLVSDNSELNEFINNWINMEYPKDLVTTKPGQVLTIIGGKGILYNVTVDDGVITGTSVVALLDPATGTNAWTSFDEAKRTAVNALINKSQVGKKYSGKVEVKPQVTPTATPETKIETKTSSVPEQAKNDLDEADDIVEESAFRLLRADNLSIESTPEEIKAEETWFKERFPNISYQTVSNLITTIGGGKAWGMFKDAAVYIYERAESGTTYHEAFEAVWNAFASIEEKKAMLDEFRRREGSFTNFSGKTIEFKSASYQDAKEQIAEEFRDWKLTGRPVIKAQPKKLNFFKRLWKFITEFVYGKPADIAETFRRIEKGYYRDMVPKVKNSMPSYREVPSAPEVHIQDMLEGMTVEFFAETFEKDEDIIVALEENNSQNRGEIYGKLYNRLQNWFEGKSGLSAYFKGLINKNPSLKDHYTRVYNDIRYGDGQNGNAFGWEFVKANWASYTREHTKFLKRFGIDIETSEEFGLDEALTQEDLENKNRVEYERDVLTISAKNAASSTIKMMFSTIANSEFADNTLGYQIEREGSTVRLAKQANYSKLFHYVLHNLAGRNTLYNMQKALADLVANTKINMNANVRRLSNRLKWENFATKTQNQMRIALKFENVFAKFKPSFTGQRVDFTGNNYTINANTNTKAEQHIREWVNNFTKGKYVNVVGKKYYIKPIPGSSSGDIGGRLVFLREAFGIKITNDQYNSLPAKEKEAFRIAVNGAQFALKDVIGKQIGSLSDRSLGLGARLTRLAEVFVTNFTGNDFESQHTNLSGKAITNFVIHNYVSLTLNDLNDVKNRQEFLDKNPHLKDIYSQESLLLKPGGLLFNVDGSIKPFKPKVSVPEGRIDDITGKRTPVDKLGLGERILYEINENINGRYYILLPADAKTEWSVDIGTYINSSDFFQNKGPQIQKFTSIMRDYLVNEIELARDFNRRKNIEQLSKKDADTGRVIGKSLRFFKDILPAPIVERIHKEVIDGSSDLNKVVSEGQLNEAIMSFMNKKVKSQRKTLEDARIIEEYEESLEFYGISKEWLKSNLNKSGNLTSNEVDNILLYRTMNYVINNIEMHKMFFMDPAQFKDATKRIKSFLSGREYSHVDIDGKNFNAWANTYLNKVGDVTLKPGTPGYHLFTNSMKTYTLRDVGVISNNIETIRKVLGDKASAYEDINETDGQSLATLTAYREMLWKAGARWTNRQEEQYQYEMAYERDKLLDKADTKAYPKELQKQDQEILAKGNPNDQYSDVTVFHTLKPIHSGVQYADGIAVASIDKTSMMPMFYRLIEGTQAENLYRQMQKNGVHYVRYESAHKVGIQKTSVIDLYNEDGSVADHSKVGYEYIPYKYYGIQVETSGVKEAQTRGTQLTKLAVSNLMKNGVPIDFKGTPIEWEMLSEAEKQKSTIYKLVKRHTEVLSELTRRGYKNILSKLGIVENADGSFTYSDKKVVADYLLNEISRRELAENLADGIKIDPITGDFNIPLEALSNYRGIRNILYSIIEKNITRPKMSGSPKVQVSTALFEKNPRIPIGNAAREITRFTPDNITELGPDEVFVFGSNAEGAHGKGAALLAKTKFGAIQGRAKGAQGNSYAIITKKNWRVEKSSTLDEIQSEIADFLQFAKKTPQKTYLVTKIGSSLAGYKIEEIKQLFKNLRIAIPDNVVLPKEYEVRNEIQAKKDKNGKIYYTSNELSFYNIGPDGKTVACEIMLPHWFRSKLRAANSKKTDAELIKYLNRPENQSILRGIGFRIPTDEVHAAEVFKVKAFLPQEFGDTVVLPSEITAKAGSDFDIDKLNLYLKNFYINSKGYPQVIEFSNIDTNDENALKDLYEKRYSKYIGKLGALERDFANKKEAAKLTVAFLENEKMKELADAGSEDERAAIEREYDDIIREASFTEELKIPRLEEWIMENKGKPIYELNSIEAVENEYYNILEELLTLPENFGQLISPTSADNIKSAAAYVKKIKNIDQNISKGINYSNLLDPDWMARERHKFIIGKGGVGIAAVSQTNIAINQISGVTIKGFTSRLPHNKVGSDISLSDINDTGDVSISSKNSGYVNGYVDVAKGADIIDMGAELSVASTMMLMEKMGTPNDSKNGYWVSLFIAQPSVQEYLKQEGLIRSTSAINPYVMAPYLATFGKHTERLSNIVRSVFPSSEALEKKVPAQFNYKKLEEIASKYYRGTKLTEEENALQMQVLKHFIELKELSGDFFKLVQGYNYDTSRFRDPNSVYRKELQYRKALELTNIDSVQKVMDNTFESAVRDSINRADEALSQIFKLHSGRAKMSVNLIVEEVNNLRGLNKDEKEKIANQGEMSLLNYIIQTQAKINNRALNTYIAPIMLDVKSAAVQLDQLKEQLNNTNSKNNRIVENLQPVINPDRTRPSTIKLIEKDSDTHMSNMYTASFRELKNDNSTVVVGGTTKTVSDIYNNLVVAQALQNGAMSNPGSFTHLLPVEDYAKLVSGSIQNMSKVNFDFFDSEKAFYRNQWNNPNIVPEAKKKEYEDEVTLKMIKVLPAFHNDALNALKKEIGIENPNNYRILRLSGFAASYAPVIKETVEAINPATGQFYTPKEKAEMRKKGDYTYRQVKLYKRVEINGEPAVTERNYKGRVFQQFIYKPINAWGDGQNLQEYYDYPRQSVVSTNIRVPELSDDQVLNMLERAGYQISNLPQEEIVDEDVLEDTPTEEDNIIDEDKAKKDLGFKKGDCK